MRDLWSECTTVHRLDVFLVVLAVIEGMIQHVYTVYHTHTWFFKIVLVIRNLTKSNNYTFSSDVL